MKKFTYGDKVRRKSGGPVRIVKRISGEAYDFDDGTFALIEDQDCYVLVERASGYFRVATSIDGALFDNHLQHGYETRSDFQNALSALLDRWAGRTGESLDERNGFLLLRFHDTPGGKPDEAWLPIYLLSPVPLSQDVPPDGIAADAEEEINSAFGF